MLIPFSQTDNDYSYLKKSHQLLNSSRHSSQCSIDSLPAGKADRLLPQDLQHLLQGLLLRLKTCRCSRCIDMLHYLLDSCHGSQGLC